MLDQPSFRREGVLLLGTRRDRVGVVTRKPRLTVADAFDGLIDARKRWKS